MAAATSSCLCAWLPPAAGASSWPDPPPARPPSSARMRPLHRQPPTPFRSGHPQPPRPWPPPRARTSMAPPPQAPPPVASTSRSNEVLDIRIGVQSRPRPRRSSTSAPRLCPSMLPMSPDAPFALLHAHGISPLKPCLGPCCLWALLVCLAIMVMLLRMPSTTTSR